MRKQNNQFSIVEFWVLLAFLVSSIIITGVSFIDGIIWDVIFIILGEIAYSIVGLLIAAGVLRGKKNCKEAYSFIIVLLILGGYAIYKVLHNFKIWVLSWPLYVKILVPSIFLVLLIGLIVLIVLHKKGKLTKNRTEKNDNIEECNDSDNE